jgi:hypothetical protein
MTAICSPSTQMDSAARHTVENIIMLTTMLAAAHRRACRRATAVTYVIPPISEELCTAANGREVPLNDIR